MKKPRGPELFVDDFGIIQYILNILNNQQKGYAMPRKKTAAASCCAPAAGEFRVEALLGVDERGQMVLPKELRENACINPGDRLAVVSWRKDGDICCLSLIKADLLTGMVKEFLGPLVSGLSGKDKNR